MHVINSNKYILTCRRAIKRKKTFEYLLNCSNRNFGKNVMTLYLAVLGSKYTKFQINLKGQYLCKTERSVKKSRVRIQGVNIRLKPYIFIFI